MTISIEDFKKVIEGEPSLTRGGVNSLYSIKAFKKFHLRKLKSN